MRRYSLLFLGIFFSLLCVATNNFAQGVNTINGGVLNGKALSLVKPDYPPAAKAVNARGAVNVEITIDERGNVISATAVSGHPLLRQASEEAAKAAKFSPPILEAKPVKVTGVLVYNFSSGDKESDIKISNFEVEADAINGQAVKLPSPVYPPSAKAVSASGKVRVSITLDEKGNVVTAKAVSGHPLLRAAAEKAAREAKFDPADIKNKAVKTEGMLIYVFPYLPKKSEN